MTQLERLEKIEMMLLDALAQVGRLRVEMGGTSKRSAATMANANITPAIKVSEVTYTQRGE